MKSKRVQICLSYLKNVSQQRSKFLIEKDAKLGNIRLLFILELITKWFPFFRLFLDD
jgi:hypothetical protein